MSEDTNYLPFVYCLIYEKKKKFCDFCFKELSKICSCPICGCMHYCNRTCEKNDAIHKFECQNFSQFSKKSDIKLEFLEDNILILFMRTLIRIIKIDDFEAQFFLELDDKCHLNKRESMANKYIEDISELMGTSFIQCFNQNELVSYFHKMIANKIEIKFSSETIGLGIYLDSSFDDSDKSNTHICFDGLKMIYKRNIFPKLSFSELASDCCYLKTSIRIANRFLKSKIVRDFYRTKIKLKAEFLHEKISQVKIVFEDQIKAKPDQRDFLAWTDRDVINKININRIFENRLNSIKNSHESFSQKELEIIIVFMSLIIIHEFAHLLYRWNGNFHSPDSKEAGNDLEQLIFNGFTRAIIFPKSKWNESSKFLGIAVEPQGKFSELKHLSYNDYIKKIYENTLPINLYLSPKFEDQPEELNFKAIKQCDENKYDNVSFEEQSNNYVDKETLNILKCGT